jgi:hypothetical protein
MAEDEQDESNDNVDFRPAPPTRRAPLRSQSSMEPPRRPPGRSASTMLPPRQPQRSEDVAASPRRRAPARSVSSAVPGRRGPPARTRSGDGMAELGALTRGMPGRTKSGDGMAELAQWQAEQREKAAAAAAETAAD